MSSQSTTKARIRPFSCGTQHGDWAGANCERCIHGATQDEHGDWTFRCRMERLISAAACDDGTISMTCAKRIGYVDAHADGERPYCWQCREWEPTEEWKAEWRRIHGREEP